MPDMNDKKKKTPLVPPQLPSFLANIFNLKPILGSPSHEQVKLVHEAIRALGNFWPTSELRDSDLSIELSQHLFDIQMMSHRQKYPVNTLPNEVVYDSPTLPSYIPVELKPVTGPPSNKEIASVHTALRISENFANVPSIFDPDLHSQLSQHLFDIQLARHVQRSMLNQLTPVPLVSNDPTHYEGTTDDNDTANYLGAPGSSGTPARGLAESTKLQNLAGERSSISNRTTHNPALKDNADLCKTNELMTEIRDTLKNMSRVLIASQNSLARGLNSSSWHECGYDLGAHTLVNENGELPEVHNLPSFKQERSYMRTVVPARTLTEDALVKYLQFYNMGKEMLEEGEELKLKPGMIEDAKNLLAQYLGSRWG